MPTYDWRCRACGHHSSVLQSISSYCREPVVPDCPEHQDSDMERVLCVIPGMSGLANTLAGDRHYDGLVASDGSDISTRSKHREYMKAKGLTVSDDFKGVWKKAAAEREALRSATFIDKELRTTIAEQVHTKLVA